MNLALQGNRDLFCSPANDEKQENNSVIASHPLFTNRSLVHNQEVNLEFIIKNCSRRRELLGNPKILFGNALGTKTAFEKTLIFDIFITLPKGYRVFAVRKSWFYFLKTFTEFSER